MSATKWPWLVAVASVLSVPFTPLRVNEILALEAPSHVMVDRVCITATLSSASSFVSGSTAAARHAALSAPMLTGKYLTVNVSCSLLSVSTKFESQKSVLMVRVVDHFTGRAADLQPLYVIVSVIGVDSPH